ncbi:MAG: FG-GAP-like repeat-containing protein [Gammaproteobacteria bacterium]|nr:FG-GAP-like repeat-containing protein [Gammaproteobacteria bacterium]
MESGDGQAYAAFYLRDGGSVRFFRIPDDHGDDDLDVVYSSNVGTKVAWFENEGGGEFSSRRRAIESGLGDSRHAFVADLDGDRDQDVLLATLNDDTVGWYENLGGGEFSARHAVASDLGGAFGVHAGDLDGDGDLDVVSAAAHDDTLAWHENLSDHGDDHSGTLDGATRVIAMPAFLYGVLESAGDRDVFRVVAGQGTLRVHSNGPTDTLGRLLDAEGAQLATNDDSGEGLNFLIDSKVAAGVHHVEVHGYSTRTGPYSLSIEFIAD